ncbi:MAG: hypothetical protein GF417_05620 [Candidatus Latescibacteria bacterium]|nr:hypothetical protein [bacterium]MBD3423894.1 hypothetical protein [Candidatus Latescibacterota bacterium]
MIAERLQPTHRKQTLLSLLELSVLILLSVLMFPSPAQAAPADSTGMIYSAVLVNRIEMKRDTSPRSWNIFSDSTSSRGRISLLAADREGGILDLHVKIRSGAREDQNWRDFLFLDQGEAALNLFDGDFSLRYFLRERVHYSRFMLLPVISSDSPYLDRNGEGVEADLRVGESVEVSYTGTRLSSQREAYDNRGLPGIRGEVATLHRLSGDFSIGSRAGAGLFISEIKPVDSEGNAVTAGVRGRISAGGLFLCSEYCETVAGELSELEPGLFRGPAPDRITISRAAGAFPPGSAFSTELAGMSLMNVSLTGGYRFYGPDFMNRTGDIRKPLSESYILAVWKHPEREAMIDFKGGDIYRYERGRSFAYLQGNVRVCLKQGFELRGNVTTMEKENPSFVLSLTDNGKISRLSTGLRLDNGDKLSFISNGWVNLSKRWTAGVRLYLFRSESSGYSMRLSYRPSLKFLFRVSAGSFDPVDSILSFERNLMPELPPENRYIRFHTRILFGGVGN